MNLLSRLSNLMMMSNLNFEPFKRPETLINADQKQEYKFIGSIKIMPGMRLYILNTETLEAEEVKIITEVAIDLDSKLVKKKKATYMKGLYVTAINKKNAERKFLKMINKMNI